MKNLIGQGKKVALGLSGGVDSSVAAYLLKEQGYEVTGVFMQCWDFKADGCRAEEDRASAVTVASALGIKFLHLDFVEQYKDRVIKYFYDEYRKGRTPNPDVMCNKEIKFGLFYKWAMENGFDYVSTGHYARVEHIDGYYRLLQGVDFSKDQSYFLYLLTSDILEKTLFPIGSYNKAEIRNIAKEAKLPTYNRPDSMGICFIGEVDIKEFLKKEIPFNRGNLVDLEGNIVGQHDGMSFYTIGQRHGFRLSTYFGIPMYVVSKNPEKNEVVIGPVKNVAKSTFKVRNLHWINVDNENIGNLLFDGSVFVRVRHLGQLNVVSTVEMSEEDSIIVNVEESIFGVAPGQSAVFYKNDVVLGGGIITEF